MSKASKARSKPRTKRARGKPLPPPQPYLLTASTDTVERIMRLALAGEGDIAGPGTVEYVLAQQMRGALDSAIEKATPKEPDSPSQIERAKMDVEAVKEYLDDCPTKVLEALAAMQSDGDSLQAFEALSELAGLLRGACVNAAGALDVLREDPAEDLTTEQLRDALSRRLARENEARENEARS